MCVFTKISTFLRGKNVKKRCFLKNFSPKGWKKREKLYNCTKNVKKKKKVNRPYTIVLRSVWG